MILGDSVSGTVGLGEYVLKIRVLVSRRLGDYVVRIRGGLGSKKSALSGRGDLEPGRCYRESEQVRLGVSKVL
jgi:hypothetical protein